MRNGRIIPIHQLQIQFLRVLVALWREIWCFRTLREESYLEAHFIPLTITFGLPFSNPTYYWREQ
jgi:hypothetical protein